VARESEGACWMPTIIDQINIGGKARFPAVASNNFGKGDREGKRASCPRELAERAGRHDRVICLAQVRP
jgi:hypothetical protein